MLDTVSKARQGFDYEQPPLLLRNDGGRFTDVSRDMGPAFQKAGAGRGAAIGDLDNDGDLDVVVSNLDGSPVVIRNESDGGRCPTRAPARNRVRTATASAPSSCSPMRADGRSAPSPPPRRATSRPATVGVHFGLAASTATRLEVHWPSGIIQTVKPLPPHGQVDVEEPQTAGRREF